jgi:hypothetical protein
LRAEYPRHVHHVLDDALTQARHATSVVTLPSAAEWFVIEASPELGTSIARRVFALEYLAPVDGRWPSHALPRTPLSRLVRPRSGLSRSDFVLWRYSPCRAPAGASPLSGEHRLRPGPSAT